MEQVRVFNPYKKSRKDKLTYKSKDFKEKNYFTLYDKKDNLIGYFNNISELSKITNYNARNLLKEFNKKKKNFIYIETQKEKYKLYTFCDN